MRSIYSWSEQPHWKAEWKAGHFHTSTVTLHSSRHYPEELYVNANVSVMHNKSDMNEWKNNMSEKFKPWLISITTQLASHVMTCECWIVGSLGLWSCLIIQQSSSDRAYWQFNPLYHGSNFLSPLFNSVISSFKFLIHFTDILQMSNAFLAVFSSLCKSL